MPGGAADRARVHSELRKLHTKQPLVVGLAGGDKPDAAFVQLASVVGWRWLFALLVACWVASHFVSVADVAGWLSALLSRALEACGRFCAPAELRRSSAIQEL